MEGVTRFNRHEVFTWDDMDLVREVLRPVGLPFEFQNMVYGLYDGFLYTEMLASAPKHMDSKTYAKFGELMVRIMKNAAE